MPGGRALNQPGAAGAEAREAAAEPGEARDHSDAEQGEEAHVADGSLDRQDACEAVGGAGRHVRGGPHAHEEVRRARLRPGRENRGRGVRRADEGQEAGLNPLPGHEQNKGDERTTWEVHETHLNVIGPAQPGPHHAGKQELRVRRRRGLLLGGNEPVTYCLHGQDDEENENGLKTGARLLRNHS